MVSVGVSLRATPSYRLASLWLRWLYTCLALVCLVQTQALAYQDLPELGSADTAALSPAQERALGLRIYRALRADPQYIDDPPAKHYIQLLGDTLVNRNNLGQTAYTFFLINQNGINAFAFPGGYIGVFSGLLLLADNEAQLASVMAHEVAHVDQRHVARTQTLQKQVSTPLLLSILAGLVLIAQGGDVEAGQAVLYSGAALNQHRRLRFSRDLEEEADSLAMSLLYNAGYDVSEMYAMFDHIKRSTHELADSEGSEFLRTHPVTNSRISRTRAWVRAQDAANGKRDTLAFQVIKQRLAVLYSSNWNTLARDYRAKLQSSPNSTPIQYGLALIQYLQQDAQAAARTLSQIDPNDRQQVYVALLGAQIAQEIDFDQARVQYDQLIDNYPYNYPIVLAYTDALAQRGEYAQAIVIWRNYLEQAQRPERSGFHALALAQQKLGRDVESDLSLAEYAFWAEQPQEAARHLQRALQRPSVTADQRRRIHIKRAQFERALNRPEGVFYLTPLITYFNLINFS